MFPHVPSVPVWVLLCFFPKYKNAFLKFTWLFQTSLWQQINKFLEEFVENKILFFFFFLHISLVSNYTSDKSPLFAHHLRQAALFLYFFQARGGLSAYTYMSFIYIYISVFFFFVPVCQIHQASPQDSGLNEWNIDYITYEQRIEEMPSFVLFDGNALTY